MSIGVFDSGIGGLTVVKEIMEVLPSESIIYFGDTARVPYGNKSTNTIRMFAKEIVDFLISKNVEIIVVACNTVSSVAIDWLRKKYSIPIIGVIEPTSKHAVEVTKNNKIGIIGTIATIQSKSYNKVIKKLNRKIKIYSKSCPLLVPLAENGAPEKVIKSVIKYYLTPLRKKGIDTLILGCTHYPIFKNEIQEFIGENVNIIDTGNSTGKLVREMIKNDKKDKQQNIFYFSDIPRKFNFVVKRFIKTPICYQKVQL